MNERHRRYLDKIAELVRKIRREKAQKAARAAGTRRRRTPAQAKKMRKTAMAERDSGMSVPDIARRHGVTATYIYMITARKRNSRR
jgi:Mor family transcriptional regulator